MPEIASDAMLTQYAASRGLFAALRLAPGDDLISGLRKAQRESGAQAMSVISCAGSLTAVTIRHANQSDGTHYHGHFEITSLTGTIDPQHQHLHLTIADENGRTYGGHLLAGSAVYTTAEIVVLLLTDIRFSREPCPQSGFDELTISKRMPLGDFTV